MTLVGRKIMEEKIIWYDIRCHLSFISFFILPFHRSDSLYPLGFQSHSLKNATIHIFFSAPSISKIQYTQLRATMLKRVGFRMNDVDSGVCFEWMKGLLHFIFNLLPGHWQCNQLFYIICFFGKNERQHPWLQAIINIHDIRYFALLMKDWARFTNRVLRIVCKRLAFFVSSGVTINSNVTRKENQIQPLIIHFSFVSPARWHCEWHGKRFMFWWEFFLASPPKMNFPLTQQWHQLRLQIYFSREVFSFPRNKYSLQVSKV